MFIVNSTRRYVCLPARPLTLNTPLGLKQGKKNNEKYHFVPRPGVVFQPCPSLQAELGRDVQGVYDKVQLSLEVQHRGFFQVCSFVRKHQW